MPDLEWVIRSVPEGTAATAAITGVALVLLKYVPSLVQDFRAIITEERELFRAELREMRVSFSTSLREVTDAFTTRDEALSNRIDGLTLAHRDLRDEVMSLRDGLK